MSCLVFLLQRKITAMIFYHNFHFKPESKTKTNTETDRVITGWSLVLGGFCGILFLKKVNGNNDLVELSHG